MASPNQQYNVFDFFRTVDDATTCDDLERLKRESLLTGDGRKYLIMKIDGKISDILSKDIKAAQERSQTNTLRSRIRQSALPVDKKEDLEETLNEKELLIDDKISNALREDIREDMKVAQEKSQTNNLRSRIRQSTLPEDKKKDLEKELDEKELLIDVKISNVLREDIREDTKAAQEKSQTNNLRSRIRQSTLPEDKKKDLEKELDEKEFEFGHYFTLIDELFVSDEKYNVEDKQKLKEHYESCCRDVPSNQPSNESEETTKRRKLEHQHVCTYKAAQKDEEPAIRTAQSRTTLSLKSTFQIWKTNLFGRRSSSDQEDAHLVPTSVSSADTCWFVAEFLFGANSGGWDDGAWKKIRRLVHGTNETDTSGNKRRMDGTGIKHMVTNKIRLSSEEKYFDQDPCIVIVPIMDKPSALEWKTGKEYAAIILIDEFGVELEDNVSLETIAIKTDFSQKTAELLTASGEEIEKAITLLREYTLAIHYAQTERKPPQLEFDEYKGKFFYPKIHNNFEGYKVRKISFSNEGHPVERRAAGRG